MSSSTSTTSTSLCACTDVKVEQFTYEWVVKKFKYLPQENGQGIYSPVFLTTNDGIEWRLSLFPQGDKKEHKGHVSIYLNVANGPSRKAQPIKTKVHVEISIPRFEVILSFIYTYEKEDGYGFGKFIQRSALLELLSSDNTFTIVCKIEVPMDTITESIDKAKLMEEALESQEGQLSQAFRLLFKEPKLSDVTVIVGTRKFQAHKLVLATRSPVFSAMFENKETQENLTNEVKIEEMEPAVVESMLEFFYTDEVTNLEELTYGLFEAADKYDVGRLRIMCEIVLYKKLNTENAAEILVHSDLHHSHKLREHVMEYIDRHLSDVVEMESYKEMEKNHPALVMELMRSIAARKKTKN